MSNVQQGMSNVQGGDALGIRRFSNRMVKLGTIRIAPLDIGHSLLDIGHYLLDITCWTLLAGHWTFITFSPLAASNTSCPLHPQSAADKPPAEVLQNLGWLVR